MKVLTAKADSPLEKAMQKIEDILSENNICMDVGRVFIRDGEGREKIFDLTSLCGGSTGMLPRSTDDEKFVLRD